MNDQMDRKHLTTWARKAAEAGTLPESCVNWSTEAIFTALEEDFARRYAGEDFLECRTCGFVAPDSLEVPRCPGCGLVSGAPPQPSAEEKEKLHMPKAEAQAPVVDIGTRRPRNGAVSTATRKASKQREDREVAEAQGKQAEAAALKALDDIEAKLEEIRARGAELVFEFAHALKVVYEGDHWKARVEEMGYRSFVHYAKERWDVQKDMCWAYLQIAKVFTKETAKGLSSARLQLLARVPDERDREKLLKRVRDGKIQTKRDLAEEVKKARQSAGAPTERKGIADSVALAGRHKAGATIADGEFTEKRGKLVFRFELGGQTYEVVANDEDMGVAVRHRK